jgi:hypothetical protein
MAYSSEPQQEATADYKDYGVVPAGGLGPLTRREKIIIAVALILYTLLMIAAVLFIRFL